MCGIFGLIQKEDKSAGKVFRDLFILSESRGKEASGFAIKMEGGIKVFKTPFPARDLIKSIVFRDEVLNRKNNTHNNFIGIGHSRLVTSGYEQFDNNNQPVIKDGMVVIHNGIIVNQNELWKVYDLKNKTSELDSELIPTIISKGLATGKEYGEAIGELFSEICGMTNIAMFSDRYNNLILATNNGSIYYINDLEKGFFVFGSEKFILEQLIKRQKIDLSADLIKQLKPGTLISINLILLSFQLVSIGQQLINLEINNLKPEIFFLKEENTLKKIYVNTSLDHRTIKVDNKFIHKYDERKELIDHLRRCKKCILPETFPFIEFNDVGVCNYCENYKKTEFRGKDALFEIAEKHKKRDSSPDCLVPFSGGRDSSYALHYVVKELRMKPIAFSYDWGMLTDLARRNQARMCGKLGVEHILVSADIRKKRENIRKNVSAWLKRPDLGTIPLFMAGDKQYFYFGNLLMKQSDLSLSVLGENILETTNFKSGFCGIRPKFKKENTYSLSIADKFKMISYYGKQYIINPAYLNSSVMDTLDSFKSYYLIKHNNLNIYDFLKWDETIINDTLIKEYDWEKDPGTNTTWRIGDGTAAFYNYIYYMVAGFTENDTFRSNQIREGDLTREEAFKNSSIENMPRWDSIQWYCRTVGLDFERTIETINKISALYIFNE